MGPKENPRQITIDVVSWSGNKLQIAILAPPEILIHRAEVLDGVAGKPSSQTAKVDGKLLDAGESPPLL